MHEFHISYSHTEWYLFFSIVQLQVHNVYSVRKTKNSCALVNMNVQIKVGISSTASGSSDPGGR